MRGLRWSNTLCFTSMCTVRANLPLRLNTTLHTGSLQPFLQLDVVLLGDITGLACMSGGPFTVQAPALLQA